MKESIVKVLTLLLGGGLVVYTGRLFFQGYDVTVSESMTVNMTALLLCMVIGLFLLAAVFTPAIVPTNRRSLLVLGIAIIVASETYLLDNPSQMVYLKDIMKLIGVFFVIVGPMKLIVPASVQKQIAEKNVEIIEV